MLDFERFGNIDFDTNPVFGSFGDQGRGPALCLEPQRCVDAACAGETTWQWTARSRVQSTAVGLTQPLTDGLLSGCSATVPLENSMLKKYFDELKRADCRAASLLAPEAVVEQSKLFAFHSTVRELHAYVIDDENTSNHHFLVTAEPLAGSIFFLSHDGDSRVVFENAVTFLGTARDAETQGLSVTDLHPDLSPVAANQISLGHFLISLLERGERNEVVVSLVPSLDLQDTALLRMLVNDSDFFLGEAVAMEIEKRPSIALMPIAALCAQHPHPQVARVGLQALQRVQQLS